MSSNLVLSSFALLLKMSRQWPLGTASGWSFLLLASPLLLLNFFLFLTPANVPGSSCLFLTPVLESSASPPERWLLLLDNSVQGGRSEHRSPRCYWASLLLRSCQGTKLGDQHMRACVCNIYTHVHILKTVLTTISSPVQQCLFRFLLSLWFFLHQWET